MSTKFVEGQVLLFYKDDEVGLVILDEITKDHFVIIDTEDRIYDFGRKIEIKHLTGKYFKRLGDIEITSRDEDWINY